MSPRVFFLILPFALTCSLQAQSPVNPGFETGLDGWSIPVSDHGMTTLSHDAAYAGGNGIQVVDDDADAGSSLSSVSVAVRPGQGCELSFQARVTHGAGIGVYLVFTDKDGAFVVPRDTFTISVPAGTEWKRSTLSAVAPEKAVLMQVWVHSYQKAKVTAQFDDFKLVEIPAEVARQRLAAAKAVPSAAKPGWTKDADLLPVFAKPHPERVFASVKILQPDGSVFRTPKEDWAGARQRIESEPQWRAWFAAQQAEIDEWMRTQHDRTEWSAGWWHDFVSPKDGSFLTWTKDVPRESASFLFSPSDPHVEITPKIFGGWVFGFRSRHMTKIEEAARLYRITGDVRYAEWAAGQLDFYADNYERWPLGTPRGTPVRLSVQSLDEAVNLIKLTDAARLLFDWAGADRRQGWYDKFFKPESELLDRSYQIIHNIAVWQRSASAQVALLYDDEVMLTRALDGEYGLRAQLSRGVTSDYIWYEQSLGYNNFVVNAFEPLLTFAGLLGKDELVRNEAAIVENLLIAPLVLRFPDNLLPNPADAGKPGHASAAALKGIRRILPTTLGIAAAAKSGALSWDDLIDPPEAPADLDPALPAVVSHHFESSRFALLKQGDWQVFFHYGQVNRSHSQSEALNWSASYKDADVSHDPGTVGYGSPLSSGYYRRGLNHNVPLVNGDGQIPWSPGELTRFDPVQAVMTGEQSAYRPDAFARRTLRIDGDRLIDEATVTCTGDPAAEARLGLALHLQGVADLPAAFLPVEDFAKDRPEAFRYWTEVRSAAFTDHAEFTVTLGNGQVLRVTFSTPGAFVVYAGSSPDYPPGRRSGFYIEKTVPAKEATFITMLAPASR
jgi:oligo-alginate lyase